MFITEKFYPDFTAIRNKYSYNLKNVYYVPDFVNAFLSTYLSLAKLSSYFNILLALKLIILFPYGGI